jgi:Single-strand binding protein family
LSVTEIRTRQAAWDAVEEKQMRVNKVILVGNLGQDPDVRRLNSGDQVVS